MSVPFFMIKNIYNKDIERLFLLCDTLNVDIFPDFKRDGHIGPNYGESDFVSVVYEEDSGATADLYRVGNTADPEEWEDIKHKFNDINDFTEWALSIMGKSNE